MVHFVLHLSLAFSHSSKEISGQAKLEKLQEQKEKESRKTTTYNHIELRQRFADSLNLLRSDATLQAKQLIIGQLLDWIVIDRQNGAITPFYCF